MHFYQQQHTITYLYRFVNILKPTIMII
jgi:hypothetical protein